MPAGAGEEHLLLAVTPVAGVDRCRLSGLVGDELVVARWDGEALSVSGRLYQRAILTVALDSLFRDLGFGRAGPRLALDGPVTDVMITLAWSCDVVDAVAYRGPGVRRAVVAVPG